VGRVFVNGEEQEDAGQSEAPPDQHLREVIAGERDAVAAYLRRIACDKERLARRMLADTMQSKPDADRLCGVAAALIVCVGDIQEGRHWR
jgi:hypothetical protein